MFVILLSVMFQWPSTVTMSKSSGQNKLGLVAAVRSTNRCSSSLELVSTCHNVSFITMACPFENLVCIHVVFLCGRHNVTQRLEQANFPANSQHIRKVALTLVCSIFFPHRKGNYSFTSQYRPDSGWENTYRLTLLLPQRLTKNFLKLGMKLYTVQMSH